MIRRRWPRLIPYLALGLLGVAYAAIAAFRGPDAWQPPAIDSADVPDDLDLADDTPGERMPFPSATAYNVIVLRNLFSATRTPPPEKDPATDGPAAASRDVALVGIVESGERKLALLRDRNSGEVAAVAPGADFRGWSLVAVSGATAQIARDGERVDLMLHFVPDAEEPGSGGAAASSAQRPRLPVTPRAGDARGNPVRARRQEERRN